MSGAGNKFKLLEALRLTPFFFFLSVLKGHFQNWEAREMHFTKCLEMVQDYSQIQKTMPFGSFVYIYLHDQLNALIYNNWLHCFYWLDRESMRRRKKESSGELIISKEPGQLLCVDCSGFRGDRRRQKGKGRREGIQLHLE